MLAKNSFAAIAVLGILVSPSLSFSLESKQIDSQSMSDVLEAASQDFMEQEIMDAIAEHVEKTDKATLAATESSKKNSTPNNDNEQQTFLENLRAQVDVAMKDPTAFASESNANKTKEAVKLAKKETKGDKEQKKAVQASEKMVKDKSTATKGWVYIGQFHNEKWNDKALKVGNELPKIGESYLVNLSSHIRKALPIKRKLAAVVRILNEKDRVRVLNIHRLGKKGHYWALVESLVGR